VPATAAACASGCGSARLSADPPRSLERERLKSGVSGDAGGGAAGECCTPSSQMGSVALSGVASLSRR
jgi:hypothetical protein